MRLVLRLRDREALDVVAAARKQAGDPRENAGLVVDDDRERVPVDRLDAGGGGVMCAHLESWLLEFPDLTGSSGFAVIRDRLLVDFVGADDPGFLQRRGPPFLESRQRQHRVRHRRASPHRVAIE